MSKKLHIVMYAAALRHWGALDPRSLSENVPSPAGTEIAMMGVARSLARRGHRVQVYASCVPGTYEGVEYVSADFAIPLLTTLESDIVVSWQDPNLFLFPLKTKLRVLMSQSTQLGVGQAADRIDRYFGISRFSAQELLNGDVYADPDKMWVTRNGVELSRFSAFAPKVREPLVDAAELLPDKRRHHMVWTSSPDRGLHHLVEIFKLLRESVPDATLDICYDFDKTRETYRNNLPGSAYVRWLEHAAQLKEQEGVRVLNHVSQPEIARLLSQAAVLAYPCDPIRQTETYCIAVTEAMAAGCAVVVSDADCLPENYDTAALVLKRPINHGEWAVEIATLMTNDEVWANRVDAGLALAAQCSFDEVAWEWECFFESYLDGGLLTPDRSLAARLGKKVLVAA